MSGATLVDKATAAVTQKATEAGNGILSWFGDALWSVVKLPGNALIGVFDTISGMAKGVFSFGTLTTGAILSLVAAGVSVMVPNARATVLKGLYGEEKGKVLEDQAKASIDRDGFLALAKQSGIAGFVAAAAFNGAGGALGTATDQAGVGRTIGGMAAIAGMLLVAVGGLKNSGVVRAADAGGAAGGAPPATPRVVTAAAATPPTNPRP